VVFVTVGNATQGFRRLLDAVEKLAAEGAFASETVFIQSGRNPEFRTAHCVQEAFLPSDRFAEVMAKADLVICHAGAGTLFNALQLGKVPVVMPRRAKYGELVDDHQLGLVRALALDRRIIPAYEPPDLPAAIALGRELRLPPSTTLPSRMLSLVTEAVKEIMERS